jgi:hypothetical protein
LDRLAGGGGLLTYIHDNNSYIETTHHTRATLPQDRILELQAFKISTGEKTSINLVNLYIPLGSAVAVPRDYSPQLQNLANIPDVIVAGDFNAEHMSWFENRPNTRRGDTIALQLNTLYILNNPQQHTHVPHQANYSNSSPDITLCSPQLALNTTWQTISHNPNATCSHTFTNFRKADWTSFVEETERQFAIWSDGEWLDINIMVERFNRIITDASKKYIPQGFVRQ